MFIFSKLKHFRDKAFRDTRIRGTKPVPKLIRINKIVIDNKKDQENECQISQDKSELRIKIKNNLFDFAINYSRKFFSQIQLL